MVFLFLLALGLPYLLVIAVVLVVRLGAFVLRFAQALRPRPARVEEDAPPAPGAIVLLVHGTFARSAAWTLPGSKLRQSITERVQTPTAFVRVNWSGRNTLAGRRAALSTLRDALAASQRRHPDVPHFIVAHSHGGNIALQCLSRWPDLQHRCSLICLSTPFLIPRPRTPGATMVWINWLLPFFAVMFAGIALTNAGWLPDRDATGVVTFWVAVAAAWVIARRGLAIARQTLEDYVPPHLPAKRLLVLRTLADEASSGIAAANLLGKATHVLLGFPMSIFEAAHARAEVFRLRFEGLSRFFLAALALSIAGGFYLYEQASTLDPGLLETATWACLALGITSFFGWAFLIGGAGFVLVIATALLGILTAPFLLFMSLLSMAAGTELALAGFYIEFTAESSPVGRWQVITIDDSQDDCGTAQGLQHSLTYQSAAVLRHMTGWMQQRLTAGNTRQSD